MEDLLARARREYLSLTLRERSIGGTARFGQMLRTSRRSFERILEQLPDEEKVADEIERIQLGLVDLEDVHAGLREATAQLQASRAQAVPVADRSRVPPPTDVAQLAEWQRELIDKLREDYHECLRVLLNLQMTVQAVSIAAAEAIEYIDQRIAWTPSAEPFSRKDLADAVSGLKKLVSRTTWAEVGRALRDDFRADPKWLISLAVATGVLLVLRPRLIHNLRGAGQAGRPGSLRTVLPTLYAIAITLVLAGTIPLAIYVISWRLVVSAGEDGWARAVSGGLRCVGWVLLAFGFFYWLCCRGGIVDLHFGWSDQRRRDLRRWLMLAGVPLAAIGFVVWTVESYPEPVWRNSLGRVAFFASLVVGAVFSWTVLRPSGPLLRAGVPAEREGKPSRLRYLWLPTALLGLAALALFSAMGYYYSALQLARRLMMTLAVVAGFFVANALCVRWVTIAVKRLSRRRARQQARAAAAGAEKGKAAPSPEQLATIEDAIEVSDVVEQTSRLVHWAVGIALLACLWGLWAHALPALEALDRYELWSYTVHVPAPPPAEGEAVPQAVEQTVPVTLADLLLAALVLVLAWVIIRGLPSVVEVLVPPRLRTDAGVRHAVMALIRYALAAAAVVLVMWLLGVRWSKVQWLVAALTVGLGFGLQAMFAWSPKPRP
ncbi:MAG: hypothetical protein ACYS5V_15950, partial [Planctomycetota bacterium]